MCRHHQSPAARRRAAGQDPRAQPRSELRIVPLCLVRNASPFWIILLLVFRRADHRMIPALPPARGAPTPMVRWFGPVQFNAPAPFLGPPTGATALPSNPTAACTGRPVQSQPSLRASITSRSPRAWLTSCSAPAQLQLAPPRRPVRTCRGRITACSRFPPRSPEGRVARRAIG